MSQGNLSVAEIQEREAAPQIIRKRKVRLSFLARAIVLVVLAAIGVECFERFKLIDAGLVCHYYRLVLPISVSRGIKILSGNNLPVEKVEVAPIGDFRQVKRCLCHLDLSLRRARARSDVVSNIDVSRRDNAAESVPIFTRSAKA
jgi:hypothetical protein